MAEGIRFEGFERMELEVGDVRINLRHGGKGPPLLLLHGNPMTHASWGKIAGRLAERYHVIAPDLRGYGDSSAPEPTPDCSNYTFRQQALDQIGVMRHFGYTRFFVAGHDRGARVAHRMALDHHAAVERVALLDILPTLHIWRNASAAWAMKSWHWVFMPQGGGVPERMLEAVPARWFIENKIGKKGIGLSIFDSWALEEYVRCFDAKTIRGSCADYRAAATIGRAHDEADATAGRKVECPVLLLWGAQSHTEGVFADVKGIWREYATDIVGEGLDSGHYVNEHRPAETLAWFERFFRA